MNSLYFACRDCKCFIEAGDRWAYATLEQPEIIRRGQPIALHEVLDAPEYWHPPDDAAWLDSVLARARDFLLRHAGHDLIFGEEADFLPDYTVEYLDWLEDSPQPITWTPRHFIEQLRFTQWREVEHYLRSHPDERPWWWAPPEMRMAARRKFEQRVLAQPRLAQPGL